MSYSVQAYAVDLARLQQVIGSHDDALVSTLVTEHAEELDAVDDVDPSLPSARDAVAALIAGRLESGPVNFKYGYALELVCRQLGRPLSNERWSAMNGEWFDTVEDAFLALEGKRKICNEVFWSGPPVALPFIDDFPAIGHVTADAVEPLADELEQALEPARNTAAAAALRELLGWLRLAAQRKLGLVTFYY